MAVEGEKYLGDVLNRGCSPSTATTYRYRLTWFGRWLAACGIGWLDVTRDTFRQWLSDERERGQSKKSMRDSHNAVNEFYEWLIVEEYMDKNPLNGIRPPKPGRKLPEVISEADVNRVIDAAVDARERVVVECLYGSGVRKSELLGVDVHQIDLSEGGFVVRGKGDVERLQPLSPRAVQAINAWLPVRAEMLAGTSHEGLKALLVTRQGRMQRQTLQNIVKKCAARAGIDRRVYPHLLRHCYATHLLNRKVPLRHVQEALGHASLATTQIYTHVAKKDLFEVIRAAHPRA